MTRVPPCQPRIAACLVVTSELVGSACLEKCQVGMARDATTGLCGERCVYLPNKAWVPDCSLAGGSITPCIWKRWAQPPARRTRGAPFKSTETARS